MQSLHIVMTTSLSLVYLASWFVGLNQTQVRRFHWWGIFFFLCSGFFQFLIGRVYLHFVQVYPWWLFVIDLTSLIAVLTLALSLKDMRVINTYGPNPTTLDMSEDTVRNKRKLDCIYQLLKSED